MNPVLFLVVGLASGAALAQVEGPVTTAALAPSGAPTPALQELPKVAPYEERLAKAEARHVRNLSRNSKAGEFWIAPWLAYFETFDLARAALAKDGPQTTGAGPSALPNGHALDIAWAGAMQGSWMARPGSAASANWTYAAGALLLLDLLAADTANQQAYAKIEKQRMPQLLTPSIHFVKKAPGAIERRNGYDTILEGDAMIRGLDLECRPSILNGANEGLYFVGGIGPDRNYYRLYACGLGAEETLNEKTAMDEVRTLVVNAYKDYEPLLRISLTDLPRMSHMKRILGAVDEREMGRLAYERVKNNVPPDWTVVFSAPNRVGEWRIFVARAGVVDEFLPPAAR
jgi:hypothetical protein